MRLGEASSCQLSKPGSFSLGLFDALEICLALTGKTNRPVQDIEEKVERGEKEKHPLVNNSSPFFGVLLLLRRAILVGVEADEGELYPVDDYRPKYEEEVDKNPKSQGS